MIMSTVTYDSPPQQPFRHISIASLFYMMTLVGVFAAMLAPFIRAIEADKQGRFIVFGIIQFTLLIVATWSTLMRSRTVEEQGGALLFRTSFYEDGHLSITAALWLGLKLLPLVAWSGVVGFIVMHEPRFLAHPFLIVSLLVATAFAARILLSLLMGVDQHDLEIRETGYIYGAFKYRPWSTIKEVRAAKYVDGQLFLVVLDDPEAPNFLRLAAAAHVPAQSWRRNQIPLLTTISLHTWPDRRDDVCQKMNEQLLKYDLVY